MTTRSCMFLAIDSSAVGLLPQYAQAQDVAQSAHEAPMAGAADTHIVSDPLYLPLKGQVYGATAYTLDMPKGDNFKAGVQVGSFKASDHLFDQTLAYGVFDNLTIRVTQGYGINNRDSTAAATGDVTSGNSSGFNDTTFSATIRVADEPRSPLIVDVTASYSPDLFASKAGGSSGSEGTIARGGQTTGVSFAVGRVMKSLTIAGTAAGTDVGQQTTTLLANGTTSQSQARWNYSVGLTSQTRFTDRVSFDAGMVFASTGNYDVSNIDTGNSHTYSPPSTRTVNLALNYHFRPNRVVGQVTYTYNNYTTATNTFAKATSDTAVENRVGRVIGVRVLYAFK